MYKTRRVIDRFGKRVSRVLSLNKTPQNTMKRATSSTAQMLTPSFRQDSTMSSSTVSSWGRNSIDFTRNFLSGEITVSKPVSFRFDARCHCYIPPDDNLRADAVARPQCFLSFLEISD
jgi:hypothetical protein